MKSVLVLSLGAAVVLQGVVAKERISCNDSGKSLLIVRGGLREYEKIAKAANDKVVFVAETGELADARQVLEEMGKRSVVWKLSKDELKGARKYRKRSKKLAKAVKKLMKSYKKSTKETLKLVTLPSGTSSKIVAAFEKRGVTVFKAGSKAHRPSQTKKLLKKAKKSKKEGSIVSFKFGGKNDVKKVKKLRKAFKLVAAGKCFKTEVDEKEVDERVVNEIGEGVVVVPNVVVPNVVANEQVVPGVAANNADDEVVANNVQQLVNNSDSDEEAVDGNDNPVVEADANSDNEAEANSENGIPVVSVDSDDGESDDDEDHQTANGGDSDVEIESDEEAPVNNGNNPDGEEQINNSEQEQINDANGSVNNSNSNADDDEPASVNNGNPNNQTDNQTDNLDATA